MPDDNRRPRISRTSSLYRRGQARPDAGTPSFYEQYGPTAPRRTDPNRTAVGQGGGVVFFPSSNPEGNPLADLPEGYEFVRMGRGGIYARRKDTPPVTRPVPDRVEPARAATYYQQAAQGALRDNIQRHTRKSVTAPTDLDQATAATMGDVDQAAEFLFDRAAPLALDENGAPVRTGSAQSRGVYGSADSLERQLPAGQDTKPGTNENYMTISAGILWLRNLAARDTDAYNRLVVMLRNAGYPGLSANDAELPLGGYSQLVGAAFAMAANDLAAANQGGDNRTLLEYLGQRGQGYADYLAQQEADRAAEDAYRPVDRRYEDPATLRAVAKQAAIEALGRALTDEEEARFEASFRARENTFYDQIDAAGQAETAFSGYAPDVGGQVDAFIEGDEFQTEAAANRIGEYASSFMRLMGVGG